MSSLLRTECFMEHTTAVESHATSPGEIVLLESHLLHCLLRHNISSREEHLEDSISDHVASSTTQECIIQRW